MSQILSIPISWRFPEDKIVWHWEKGGEYSVRSAYHLLKEEQHRNNPEASSQIDQNLWKAIWKLDIPNCVRNFLWRMAKNILPTRCKLEKKGIQLDTCCALCGIEKENREHLFMHCNLTKMLWFSSPLGIHVPPDLALNSWLLHWFSNPEKLAQQIFSVTLWKLWKGRNQLIFNNQKFNPITIAADAASFTEEFNDVNKKELGLPRRTSSDKWKPPSMNSIKVNTDAGCFENGSSGWSFIARNHLGQVCFAATKLVQMKLSPTLAEAMCLRWCLDWTKDQNYENIIVETDAEVVARCINDKLMLVEIDHIILDCLSMLDQMVNVAVKSVRRSCNAAAHGLVGAARSLGTVCWEGIVPDPISSIICNESLSSLNE